MQIIYKKYALQLSLDDEDGFEDADPDGSAVINEWMMKHPLLMSGIIVAPQRIDHDAYLHVMDGITKARILLGDDAPIELYLSGVGGDADYAFAIGDFVRKDGKVVGVATGCAYSSHALIWALCPYRVISSNGTIALHQISSKIMPSAITDIISEAKNLQDIQHRIEDALSDISTESASWWANELRQRIQSCLYLTAAEADSLGMVKPFVKAEVTH